MQAVIDRFEGELAILLLGEDEEEQLSVSEKFLPEDAKAGDYLKLKFELDKAKTEQRAERVKGLLDELNE